MNRSKIFIPLALTLLLVALLAGCDKERIVESTEIIHDIEYIELPPDTVIVFDTVVTYDSVTIIATDTLMIVDTVTETNTIYDTVIQVNTIYDTIFQTNTIYETVTDTVVVPSNEPNELLALGVLEYYVDPLVLEFVNAEFGLNDGWIYYLSAWQTQFTRVSAGVYDIAGYIEFWATDWSGYYPLEYNYRMTHTGGDPADINNWQISEPAASPANPNPGLKSTTSEKQTAGSLMR